jgi:hypothetical protein
MQNRLFMYERTPEGKLVLKEITVRTPPKTVGDLIQKLQTLDPALPCICWVDGEDRKLDFDLLGGVVATISLPATYKGLDPGTHEVLILGPLEPLKLLEPR